MRAKTTKLIPLWRHRCSQNLLVCVRDGEVTVAVVMGSLLADQLLCQPHLATRGLGNSEAVPSDRGLGGAGDRIRCMAAWRIAVGFVRRRPRVSVAALTAVILIAGAALLIRSRGATAHNRRHDLGRNGIWLQHGWLGHDLWFQNNKKVDRIPSFRSEKAIQDLGSRLRAHHITDVFPHLCPTDQGGRIAAVDDAQVERFLDLIAPVRVIPWVGGTRGGSAHPNDPAWRQGFAGSIGDLLREHPRLSGVQINIEPMPSGDGDYLATLDEVRRAMPKGKLLSIAAYPPPTALHPFPEVHWDERYFRQVGSR